MDQSRIETALARIEAAMARLDRARTGLAARPADAPAAPPAKDPAGSARVMELVNRHEKLREEVADSLRDLDRLIEELED